MVHIAGGIAGVLSFAVALLAWLTPPKRDISKEISEYKVADTMRKANLWGMSRYRCRSGFAAIAEGTSLWRRPKQGDGGAPCRPQ